MSENAAVYVGQRRSALGLVAWVCVLVLVLVILDALGRGVLAGPPLAEPGAWMGWARQREPVVALFAVLRLGVLALGWYLLVVSLAGIAVRVLRARRLIVVADLVTVPMVRRMLQGALGVSLATAPMATGTALATELPPSIVEIHDETEADAEWWRITAEDIRGEATAQPAGEPWVTRETAQPEAPAAQQQPAGQWQVQAGEHFWSKAEQVVGQSLGREASQDEVESYWLTLVRENRAGLADPDNPDLIYPGQVFTLPTVPGASGG